MRRRDLQGRESVDGRGPRPGRAIAAVGALGLGVVLLVAFVGGGDADPGHVVTGLRPAPSGDRAQPVELHPTDLEYASFAEEIVTDLDLLWADVFSRSDRVYHASTVVLFRGFTDSACGGANEQVGPHYCPLDSTIYLDETFFDALSGSRPQDGEGDFAEAYIIAHQVGHHVQNELGILHEARSLQASDPDGADQLSVELELQADCFAGVWAFTLAQRGDILDPAAVDEALAVVAAVAGDRVQQKTSGMLNRESWTHGSAAERAAWVTVGYRSGDPAQCDTSG